MKTMLILAFSLATTISFAQTDNAYWVTEQNVNRRDVTTVRFYSDNHVLLHEAVIQGRIININKRKDKRLLDQLLVNYLSRENSFGKKQKPKRPV